MPKDQNNQFFKNLNRIGLALLLYALVAYLYSSARQKESTLVQVHPIDLRAFEAVNWFPGHGLTGEEKRHYLDGVRQRVDKLAKMEQERARRERAAREMPAARAELQWAARQAWNSVLQSNQQKFEQLRQVAAKTSLGQTPCTICDGYSYMPCIMCQDHSGKCAPCGGSGYKVAKEYCPACSGTGNCYLCGGIGKMLCPFCDDGTIDIHYHLPSKLPPNHLTGDPR